MENKFKNLSPEWKIVIGTITVMFSGVVLLLLYENVIMLPDAVLFGAAAMWISGGILTLFWIIKMAKSKENSELEKWR